MLKLAVILLALLCFSPAKAANELQGAPIAELTENAAKHGVLVVKLNDAETAKMDAAQARPIADTEIYLMTKDDSCVLMLIKDGVVVLNTAPKPVQAINNLLGRVGA